MIQFLMIMNDCGVVRYRKVFVNDNTFLLDNYKVACIYQHILKTKSTFTNNFKVDDSFESHITYRQYANLYFIIGSDSDKYTSKYNILIHNLVERIDLKFNYISSEANIISNNLVINDIIESMNII
jgi:hypothetical protein